MNVSNAFRVAGSTWLRTSSAYNLAKEIADNEEPPRRSDALTTKQTNDPGQPRESACGVDLASTYGVHRSLVFRNMLALSLAWCSAALGGLSIIGVLVWLYATIWAGYRDRPRLALFTLLASPYVLAFLVGVGSYVGGTARILGIGYSPRNTYVLDRQTRAPRASVGCIGYGNEWVWQVPSNVAVRGMAAVFGPMPGSYDGPYPTGAEVDEAIVDAEEAVLDDEGISFGGRTVRLAPGVARWAEGCLQQVTLTHDGLEPALTAAMIDTVLIIDDKGGRMLVDSTTGKAFSIDGSFQCRDLPPPDW